MADSITETMMLFREELGIRNESWHLLIGVGAKKYREVQQMFNGCGICATVVPYFQRMDLAYALADLVVMRGGAGSIAEIRAKGLPAVIFPYPHHADRQQYLNAAPLVESGQAIVIDDTGCGILNAKAMRAEVTEILDQPQWLAKMRTAPERVDATSAAREVAQWLRETGNSAAGAE